MQLQDVRTVVIVLVAVASAIAISVASCKLRVAVAAVLVASCRRVPGPFANLLLTRLTKRKKAWPRPANSSWQWKRIKTN